ncbi:MULTISPECIES: HAD family hydrolase [Clostridium]|uniref:HAD family hydrolase n=1 Tax=Clostridium TaxID=1485 RepID=UPI000826B644|nr:MULTISPECIES: HAD-IA family hydrolase [Clostridium]PJI09841.1 hydrolase [Clostridium sp. CT7]
MIKLIIFDLDDTLYDERDFVIGGFKDVCKYLSLKYLDDYDLLMEEILNILNKDGRGKIFNVLCENHDYNEDIKKLVRIYRQAKPKLKLYDDSRYTLSKLKGKYKLGIITDGLAAVQWNKIKLLNIENFFDKIIVTDDLGKDFSKPSEVPYMKMLEYFNLNAEDSVYIGDNPHKDFIGARKVGMNTVRIIREHGDHKNDRLNLDYEADCEIHNLNELMMTLK